MKNKTFNTNPSGLSIDDYNYALPDARIARYPLTERDTSKLLVYKNGALSEKEFKTLPSLLNANDCLVFNDTRVVHARIYLQKPTGASIEVLCLEPIEPAEVAVAFASKNSTVWKVMVGNAKRWKVGEVITKCILAAVGGYELKVELISKGADACVVRFFWESDYSFAEVLDDAGILPLPPYLNRNTEEADEERYQTVYAQADGSVAAPTAGLHFTQDVFDQLKEKEINSLFVTLHVGAGTFKPVRSQTMEGHHMHKERILVSLNAIKKMRLAAASNRIVAVGTTSLRTIESIYWFGVKLLAQKFEGDLLVGQWDPYELERQKVSISDALDAVIDWLNTNGLSYVNGYTQLLIAPGYRVRMASALITNFHQPKSTLLLLVAALIGEDWRKVYDHALNNDFRFLSFGDSSILFKNTT